MRFTIRALPLLLIVLSAISGACVQGSETTVGDESQEVVSLRDEEAEPLRVLTFIAPIANIVYNIGGDHITLHAAVKSGADPHTYSPAPSVAIQTVKADLIFINGQGTVPVAVDAVDVRRVEYFFKEGSELVALGDVAIEPDEYISTGKDGDWSVVNPHVWMDPLYALKYAEIVRDKLVAHDPENAGAYRANYNEFAARIATLDEAIQATTASIPKENRKLYTYHDSFPYFARRYGYTVLGAIQPNDVSEPSAIEVAEIIEALRSGETPAIFDSAVYQGDVVKQIGREAGITHKFALYDDSLPGHPGEPGHTYIGMMVENMKVFATALGGDPALMEGVEIGNVPDVGGVLTTSPAHRAKDEPLRVLTALATITDIVHNVGGEHILIHNAMPPGVDISEFEPTPSDARAIADADLIVFNGLGLRTGQRGGDPYSAVKALKEGADFLVVGDMSLGVLPGDEFPVPQLWHDPIYGLKYAEIIRDTLVRLDPKNGDEYRSNYEQFAARIEVLDAAIRTAIASIPDENRILYAFDQTLDHFARRYGLTMMGPDIAVKNLADLSPQHMAELIEEVRDSGASAVFGSVFFPSDVLEQIGREADVSYGALSNDTFPGQPGDQEYTYIGMVAQNARSITAALGGDPSPLNEVEAHNVPQGEQ